ncbi:hypothetical protein [Roseateles saccharophilus]|nr:hypothetical protein [Roseateles saccharophilus]MDG0836164.1 hypothetical protein [Roseateles saccharophilus]
MRELLFAVIPSLVFIVRYHPKPSVPQLLGLFLMEAAPFLIAASLFGTGFGNVLFGFLLLYSVYEVGYIHNDIVSAKEKDGRTDRSQFAGFRIHIFLAARIPIIIGMIAILYSRQDEQFLRATCLLIFLLGTFLLHNLMLSPRKRVFTFLALNTLKIFIRFLLLIPGGGAITIASMPHIIVKLLHYLKSKKLISIAEIDFRHVGFYTYAGFAPLLLALDLKIFLVALPYFLNHNKSLIYDYIRPFLLRLKK